MGSARRWVPCFLTMMRVASSFRHYPTRSLFASPQSIPASRECVLRKTGEPCRIHIYVSSDASRRSYPMTWVEHRRTPNSSRPFATLRDRPGRGSINRPSAHTALHVRTRRNGVRKLTPIYSRKSLLTRTSCTPRREHESERRHTSAPVMFLARLSRHDKRRNARARQFEVLYDNCRKRA